MKKLLVIGLFLIMACGDNYDEKEIKAENAVLDHCHIDKNSPKAKNAQFTSLNIGNGKVYTIGMLGEVPNGLPGGGKMKKVIWYLIDPNTYKVTGIYTD